MGGGAKGPLWRQIKADVTGLPVRVPESVETTATGAAILAAVGSGVHATVADAVEAFVSFRPEEHEPDPGGPRRVRRGLPALPRRVLRAETCVRTLTRNEVRYSRSMSPGEDPRSVR